MLPAANDPVWGEIATGKRSIRSDNLAMNLLAKSNQMSFERDSSKANVERLAANTYEFFVKYEKSFANEFAKCLA